MHKLMMFMKRKEGVSFEDFRSHYENVHIPTVAKWVGHLFTESKRYYLQHSVNFYAGRPDADQAPTDDGGVDYDAVSVYTVRDEAALAEVMRIAVDPEFTRWVTEDEANFVDRARSRQTVTEEITRAGMG
ncbi:EthD domain-containing protein [Sphingobium sp. 3R8]|uniref:EthD domain-containing protein n=1 Tax=Sphingobium sp. 3R8 TaxID=2874921 RepID=UPI001CCA0BBF|nr:EthD domain-containing protein [Sphingobium sp. 3R8]MBZ9646611.1 EthD domain-containing protein [Sphingobium sp. 3R8]